MSLNGGYAMIKYNSTQEELQTAYRSKRPVLFYDENQRAHRAVIEETTTQSVDQETQEPITIYKYSYRLLNDIEALVDRNGKSRFIGGNGTPGNVSGVTITSSKWVLNGNNLIFEIEGNFLSKDIPPNSTLCKFTLPEWIAQKITLIFENVVDLLTYNVVTEDWIDTSLYCIYKEGNVLNFSQFTGENAAARTFFKIHYNIIIDNN